MYTHDSTRARNTKALDFRADTATVPIEPGAPRRVPSGVIQRGASLGRYIVLHALGSGGMGHVYAAFDPELDRKVALKVLSGDLLDSDLGREGQRRLRREAQAAAKLDHSNVVAVHDVGTVGERVFIAMELIEGQTMASWLETRVRSWRSILDLFIQAGRGLAAAHAIGLVHRDFKPGNLMVARDGRVRVLDFGLACPTDEPTSEPEGEDAVWRSGADHGPEGSLTQNGKLIGTPAYMAPELYAGRAPDARADQFSFCVALYEALYAELPFAGNTPEEMRRNLQRGRVRRARAGSRVPGWLRQVLLRGLAADPEARFPTLEDLLRALSREARTRRLQRAVVAAVSLLAAILIGTWILRSGRPSFCQGAERRLAGIWDPASRDGIQAAFEATGAGYAEATWQSVARTLESYSADWVHLHTEVCEATHLRGEQSAEMLDRQMACLDDRLFELSSLARLFRSADEPLVRQAISASQALSGLAGCRDRRTLTSMELPPAPLRGRVEEVRKTLADVKALHAAARYPEALRLAEKALAEARDLDNLPILGEAHYELGRVYGRLHKIDELEEHLVEAAALAQASGHDELLARAQTILILPGYMRGDAGDAKKWGRLAETAIEVLGGRDDLEARRLFYMGMVSNMAGNLDEAIELFDRSAAIDPQLTALDKANLANNKGLSLRRLGRHEEALETLQQGVRYAEIAYEADHPSLALLVGNLGNVFSSREDFEPALELHRKALAINQRALGPDHWSHRPFLGAVGVDLIELDRPREAIPALERAVQLGEAGNPWDLAQYKFGLARALHEAGQDPERALVLARVARELYVSAGSEADTKKLDTWLADEGLVGEALGQRGVSR